MKVVFILGTGHCGATLLNVLFDSHSQVFGVGELHAARAGSICTCGKPASECHVWQNALGPLPWTEQVMFKRKLDFLFDRGAYRFVQAPDGIDAEKYIADNVDIFRKLLSGSKKSVIVDASKEPERAELLSASPDIEPIVIHLVRDGRGVTWAYIRKYTNIFPHFYLWALSNLKIEIFRHRFARKFGGRGKFIYLRFADLANDTEHTLRFLCDEIGIPYEPGMLLFDEHEHHQVEGNRMRFVRGHTIHKDVGGANMPYPLRAFWTTCFGLLNVYYTRIRKTSVADS